MSKEKIKVYLYTRVSTSIQIDGYSLEAQKSRMKAFALYCRFSLGRRQSHPISCSPLRRSSWHCASTPRRTGRRRPTASCPRPAGSQTRPGARRPRAGSCGSTTRRPEARTPPPPSPPPARIRPGRRRRRCPRAGCTRAGRSP